MKNTSLSSVILFSLVIFFIMQNRIGPGDTPYILFGVIFLLLIGYVVVDLIKLSEKTYNLSKNILLWVTIIVVLGSGFISSMVVRHETAPVYGVNDIVLQQEAAIRYFIHGKNPYKETYFGTPMQAWHYSDTQVNPALYHFVMEPMYLLIPIPFYWASNHLFGYFDSREVLWLLFAGVLLISFAIPKEQENKRLLVSLLAFNPATLGYVLEGRSDMFGYFFLLAGFFLLEKRRFFWSGILIGISFLVKQSSWPLFPFYIFYISYFAWKEKARLQGKIWLILKNLIGFIILFVGVSLPFYLWNSQSYIASTISYLSGTTTHSYPISGYGFSVVLSQLGFIKDVNAYYPFQIWQAVICIPVLILLLWMLWKKPSVQKVIVYYGLFLFIFWYFSRYFNNSHVGYISTVLITAYFWPAEQKT